METVDLSVVATPGKGPGDKFDLADSKSGTVRVCHTKDDVYLEVDLGKTGTYHISVGTLVSKIKHRAV